MKITDKLVEKVGYDKLLHFLVAAWVVSACLLYGTGVGCIAWIIIILLSIIKEKIFDDYSDTKDIIAGALGGFVSLLLSIFSNI
jgi:Na+-transporting NADH:ubiquinone oxidoreductase subunit NqrE